MISLCNSRGHEHIATVTNYMGNKASSKTGPHMLLACHCKEAQCLATH
jgi:hypothetical protein